MKQSISNIVYVSIILFSFIIIAISVFFILKTSQNSKLINSNLELYNDPLTNAFFDSKLIDVGNLPQNTIILRDYILKNNGEHPLIVYYISPDCNCTDYKLSSKSAMPNDSIVVTLMIDTKNKNKGMFMLNTVLRANTPQQMYRLRLQGNILANNDL